MTRSKILFLALCLAPTLALAQMATAPFEGRLKKIHDTKTIALAYRTDALPFSFEDKDKKPAGYSVDLCRSVVGLIERQPIEAAVPMRPHHNEIAERGRRLVQNAPYGAPGSRADMRLHTEDVDACGELGQLRCHVFVQAFR